VPQKTAKLWPMTLTSIVKKKPSFTSWGRSTDDIPLSHHWVCPLHFHNCLVWLSYKNQTSEDRERFWQLKGLLVLPCTPSKNWIHRKLEKELRKSFWIPHIQATFSLNLCHLAVATEHQKSQAQEKCLPHWQSKCSPHCAMIMCNIIYLFDSTLRLLIPFPVNTILFYLYIAQLYIKVSLFC